MMRIAVIDDEKEVLEIVKNYICNINNLSEVIDVHTFEMAEDVLELLEKGDKFDIILSDIELEKMKGLEFGEIVRERYPQIYFVFLTSYSEFAAQSYAINAYQYILKADLHIRLEEIIRELAKKIHKERDQFRIIGTKNEKKKLYYRDIIYIKKNKGTKYIQYITLDGEYRERASLENLMQEINCEDFILIERGYAVNMNHIVGMKGNTIQLINNDEVAVSGMRLMKVKNQIHDWWGRS